MGRDGSIPVESARRERATTVLGWPSAAAGGRGRPSEIPSCSVFSGKYSLTAVRAVEGGARVFVVVSVCVSRFFSLSCVVVASRASLWLSGTLSAGRAEAAGGASPRLVLAVLFVRARRENAGSATNARTTESIDAGPDQTRAATAMRLLTQH